METPIDRSTLEFILTSMFHGDYTPEQGEQRLREIGVPETLAHTFAFQFRTAIEQVNELTALADKADESHLAHCDVSFLVDLAYEHDLIDYDVALSLLLRDGNTHESADHNLETTRAIRDRNASRAEYLDDPSTAKRYCTICGRQCSGVVLSRRGICRLCQTVIHDAHTDQMTTRSGPYYRRWRAAMIRSMYRLEDEEMTERKKRIWAGPHPTLDDLYDHDKAPPCQGDCDDCDSFDCPSRVSDYVERTPDDSEQPSHGVPEAFCTTTSKYADNKEATDA